MEQTPSTHAAFKRAMSLTQSFGHDSPSELSTESRRATTINDFQNSPNQIVSHALLKGDKTHLLRNVFEFRGSDGEDADVAPRKKRKYREQPVEVYENEDITSKEPRSSTKPGDHEYKMLPPACRDLNAHTQASQNSTLPTLPGTSPFGASHCEGDAAQDAAEEFSGIQEPVASNMLSPSPAISSSNDSAVIQKNTVKHVPPEDLDELDMNYPSIDVSTISKPAVLVRKENEKPSDVSTLTANDGLREKPKTRREKRDENVDELGSDDVGIGIAKEQYNPRPSRSRSRRDEELVIPTEFSKRPETATKAKKKSSKRSKTTAFHELIPRDADEEVVEEDDQPLPDKPELKIPKYNGKAESYATNSKQTAAVEGEAVKVPKKQRGRPKKGAERKLFSGDELEKPAQSQSVSDYSTTSDAPKIGKRIRRSKKSLTTVNEVPENDGEDDDHNSEIERQSSPEKATEPLSEVTGNVAPARTPEKAKDSTPPDVANVLLVETPQLSPTNTAKGPTKHSPISTGKVLYRVGLSKRARIEPLLRIVRK